MPSPSVSELRRIPGFPRWLKSRAWTSEFDPRSLQRGRRYAASGAVLTIQLEGSDGADEFEIAALVLGTRHRPYEVEITLSRVDDHESDWCVDAYCSCPVCVDCKHAAAVLTRLEQFIGELPRQGDLFGHETPRELSQESNLWLRKLAEASGSLPSSSKPPPANQFLAYCIEPVTARDAKASHRLVLRPASRRKNSAPKIKNSQSRADPSSPSAYMTPADYPLAALYNSLTRKFAIETGELRGPGWQILLEGALSLQRLYYGSPGNGYDAEENHHLLTGGPPIKAEVSWDLLEDGRARPVVQFSQPQTILLSTEPPLYLDLAQHRLGTVESDTPAQLLTTWAEGPVFDPDDISLLGEGLAGLPPAAALPAPIEIPTTHLTDLKPAPHLRICESSLGRHRPLNSIIGELTFRYGETAGLFPLSKMAPSRSTWIDGDTRFILERNRPAERAFEQSLQLHDLVPLHQFFEPHELNPDLIHAVTVENPRPSLAVAWLNFLAEHADDLRAAGWTVEVDPQAGLTVHDLTEFVPAIETDPDHGIDWFKFELKGEDGERSVSLIPVIAHAIAKGLPDLDDPDLPDSYLVACEDPKDGHYRIPARRFLEICHNVAHLFHGKDHQDGPLSLDRLAAAGVADTLAIDDTETNRALAALGKRFHDLRALPATRPPAGLKAELRPYQLDGYRWLRFLADNELHGILADDMGLGKTVQTLALLASGKRGRGRKPSLVVAPTSVVGNWIAEAAKFTPGLKVLLFHGSERSELVPRIPSADLVVTSYPLLARDHEILTEQEWRTVVLDEAQYIKNPKTAAAQHACELKSAQRLCLSGTPMENHLGELWSLMRFLMPGFLGNEKSFGATLRRPIERHQDSAAQLALNRRVAPLILRRTKDQVATELPPKTEIVHAVQLSRKEADLYESVRAAMDKRVREALAEKGMAKSHIIVLDALLKLRQICCHPSLLKTPAAQKMKEGSKLEFLSKRLLPELLEEGRRILLFSQFTSMLALIEAELKAAGTPYLKLTGQTKNRAALVESFQQGEVPVFLISLKAGGTGLNLTAADTVIHYDPWWNPAVEMQATDRAHRIGQEKPVFVHKLICEGTIEDRILELQRRKSALVKALLSDETTKLRIDPETLSHLLAPLV